MRGSIVFFVLFFGLAFSGKSVFARGGKAGAESDSTETVQSGQRKVSYWNRLFRGNIDRTFERKVDMSIVATPFYGRETSFGIGSMATGLYRIDRSDSIAEPSNFSGFASVSLTGFYSVGITGNNNFKGARSRLQYSASFANKPLDLWGFDFETCDTASVSSFTRRSVVVSADYSYRIARRLFVGGAVKFSYMSARRVGNMSFFGSRRLKYTFTGVGLLLQYDSRNSTLMPDSGVLLMIRETVFPRYFSSYNRTLWQTAVTADFFASLWRGCILAADIYAVFNSSDMPWPLREELGGISRMRGYYAGRYRDNDIVSAQLELRQGIIHRLGCAAWVGCGSVFSKPSEFSLRNLLPTYGVGIRWEFKHRVNLRVDYGFGRRTGCLVLGLNEAF